MFIYKATVYDWYGDKEFSVYGITDTNDYISTMEEILQRWDESVGVSLNSVNYISELSGEGFTHQISKETYEDIIKNEKEKKNK